MFYVPLTDEQFEMFPQLSLSSDFTEPFAHGQSLLQICVGEEGENIHQNFFREEIQG